jgi:RNA polymerase sigma factor (sigma-70 family)
MTEDRKNTDQTTTNAELVEAALSGDRDAWERLVRRYDTALHRVARSFRVDQATADDAVQTTWLRLVEHLDSLRDPDRLGSWLITTVRRQIIAAVSHHRRGPGVVGLDGTDPAGTDRSPEELVTEDELSVQTKAALGRLPARNRTLLTLLVESELSYREVSAMLHMPVGSIGPVRARSLDLLRRELAAVGIDGDALIA